MYFNLTALNLAIHQCTLNMSGGILSVLNAILLKPVFEVTGNCI